MKRLFVILTALLICASSTTAFADSPTCVMLQFSNDTRFKNIDSASLLSELVFEKLLATGKLNFKETKPIDKDMELMLYDEKMRDINNLHKSIAAGNFNALFEDGSFDSNHAQSIATAKVGQIVSPTITSAIGREHGADYLIQGTIINLGQGEALGSINTSAFYYGQKTSVIGIMVAVRVIKAETGEVVWAEEIIGDKRSTLHQVGSFIKFGSAKLTTDMYSQAIDEAAQKISDALIAGMVGGRLFAK